MPLPHGGYYRIKTYPSGKRVRFGILGGRVIETTVLASRKQTKTRRHLKQARRRIRL